MPNRFGFRTDLDLADAPPAHHGSDKAELRRDPTSAVMLENDISRWDNRMDELMKAGAKIITFRGAGSVNGIEPTASSQAVGILKDYILNARESGAPVVLMYDGDGDNRARPDIGSVFGELADTFGRDSGVIVIAAQSKGWYSPASENGPITSASNTKYETYVFGDELEGQHARLTQSAALAGYENYEQVFVGPAGKIAFSQLEDLNEKSISSRPIGGSLLKVTVLSTGNNPALAPELAAQLEAAKDDEVKAGKVVAKIKQREQNPYGFLCTRDGQFNLDSKKYLGLSFASVRVN